MVSQQSVFRSRRRVVIQPVVLASQVTSGSTFQGSKRLTLACVSGGNFCGLAAAAMPSLESRRFRSDPRPGLGPETPRLLRAAEAGRGLREVSQVALLCYSHESAGAAEVLPARGSWCVMRKRSGSHHKTVTVWLCR